MTLRLYNPVIDVTEKGAVLSDSSSFSFVFFRTVNRWYRLNKSLPHHSLSDSLESSDVSAGYEVLAQVILCTSILDLLEDVDHDAFQLSVNIISGEYDVLSVLAHLQAGACNSAGVCSLGRSNNYVVSLQVLNSLVCGRHVSSLDEVSSTVLNHLLSVLKLNVVLHCTRDVQVCLYAPWLLARDELSTLELLCVRSADVLSGSSQLQQVVDLLAQNSVLVQDVSVWTGECDDLSSQLLQLLSCSPGNVSESGDNYLLALDALTEVLQDLSCEEYDSVSSSLCSSVQSAVLCSNCSDPLCKKISFHFCCAV